MSSSLISLSQFLDPKRTAKLKEIEQQIQVEQLRAGREYQNATLQAENQRAFEMLQHSNRMREMLGRAVLDAQTKSFESLVNLENDRVGLVFDSVKQATATRNEIFKMTMQAIIQNKLAQAQHKREMEKMGLQHEFKKFCDEVSRLHEQGKQEAANLAVDSLVNSWNMR